MEKLKAKGNKKIFFVRFSFHSMLLFEKEEDERRRKGKEDYDDNEDKLMEP